jgi:hypothetical protein
MTIPSPLHTRSASVLSPADLADIHDTLLDERRLHLERLAWLDEDRTESFDDRAATSALHSLLVDIDAALQRLEHGDYGQRETCGRPVPAARLRALPHTTGCVECV